MNQKIKDSVKMLIFILKKLKKKKSIYFINEFIILEIHYYSNEFC